MGAAFREFLPLAEQGNALAQNRLGVMYEYLRGVPQNYAEAVKWYRKAAEQGLASAQSNLGTMYRNGQGVPENDAEAIKWYRRAAKQGFAEAQHNLGNRHLIPTPEPYSHGPCAVIAEPRRLKSKPFEQNPVQAPA